MKAECRPTGITLSRDSSFSRDHRLLRITTFEIQLLGKRVLERSIYMNAGFDGKKVTHQMMLALSVESFASFDGSLLESLK